MDSFTWCGNGNGCDNGTVCKWVPTLFCVAAAAAKYFALTLHYCTVATAAQCEYFQQQCNENEKKSQLLPHCVNGPLGWEAPTTKRAGCQSINQAIFFLNYMKMKKYQVV